MLMLVNGDVESGGVSGCRLGWGQAIKNLLPRKLNPLDIFNEVAAAVLTLTGFQHVSRVGEMRGHSTLLSVLVERWRPETHTFHLPVGEVTVTLEEVSYILGLLVNGEAVTGRSDSSHQFLVENCIACFGREPGPQDHVLGKVNLAWVWRCRDTEPCDTQESVERYVRAHIFCVLGTFVFLDKSTTSLNSKFLPLLWNFDWISSYSWGAASLAHLYRSLCRASRYNCKEMDGPLILLFVWAWERMPLLAPIPRDQFGDVGFSLARRWSHWRRHTRYIRRHTAHFRRGLDDMGVEDESCNH
ncbi:serine/threonine-protein phosphatase 7 long form homolog [Arachis hypogaea]|uniref:serine/threonine-protein phosphatase 7 long form homolog n=1 Tax=Arachis hypogaea TaxID=3818 RepID=UPI000DECF577|nr:serine/threonine-protein phosphatase 7 long form homolog [Arachis hypogaea]